MTKQTLKKTTSKSSKATMLNPAFGRWLLPAILSVTFYIISVLIVAISVKSDGGLTPESSLLASILFTLAISAAAWWLLESARWAMAVIERKKPATKSKKK